MAADEEVHAVPVEEPQWVIQQKKTFKAWTNSKLNERKLKIAREKDIADAFEDGINLIQLAEVLTKDACPKYTKAPKMRIQKTENCKLGLGVLEKSGFRPDIGAEMFVDGNSKMILGFIWQLFCRFCAAEAAAEKADANALLKWVQERVNGKPEYPGLNVTNFTNCWQDGLAVSALLNSISPEFVNFAGLNKDDKLGNLNNAFRVAEEQLEVPRLLEAEDLVNFEPDDKSVKMYVQLIKNAYDVKQAEIRAKEEEIRAKKAAEEAEKARRAALTKEEILKLLDEANDKLGAIGVCPNCHKDINAWLAQQGL
jgi:hypothetical protein